MALRGVFQPLKRREFTLNPKNCPVLVLSNRTILTLSCRHPISQLPLCSPKTCDICIALRSSG